MKVKVGRNDPCWCGSGKKYKKCHLDRARLPAVNPFTAEAQQRQAFSKKYCLYPKAGPHICKGDIVKAHTVQRAGGLSGIARRGHVLKFDNSLRTLISGQGQMAPVNLGINRASTFTGFCAFHDNSVFSPLEASPFAGGRQQIFLLGYRALCRELFTKKAALDASHIHRGLDRGKDVITQVKIQTMLDAREAGLRLGLRNLSGHKGSFDQSLLSGDFSRLSYYLIELENAAEVLCSFGLYPEIDFHGNRLQDLGSVQQADLITCSIIATDRGGAVVFAWMDEVNNACTRLIRSLALLDISRVPDAIVRFVFESGENTFFSPHWWEGLSQVARERLQRHASSIMDKPGNCLMDDQIRYVAWRILSRPTTVNL